MCLGRCPRVHTPPAIPPIATSARTLCQRTLALRRLPAQRFVGLTAAASQRRDAARSLGRERLTRDMCARTPRHNYLWRCPARAARATQHLSTRRMCHGARPRGGSSDAGQRHRAVARHGHTRLTTNALYPPAPSLCGMGFRRKRAGQPPVCTSIRAGNVRSHCVVQPSADGRAPPCGAQMVKSKGTLRL